MVDLKQAGVARRSHEGGLWLVSIQVMLGVVMLNMALLLAGTLLGYVQQGSGFSADRVVLGEFDFHDMGLTEKQQQSRALEVLRQVQAMPGVRTAALLSMPCRS